MSGRYYTRGGGPAKGAFDYLFFFPLAHVDENCCDARRSKIIRETTVTYVGGRIVFSKNPSVSLNVSYSIITINRSRDFFFSFPNIILLAGPSRVLRAVTILIEPVFFGFYFLDIIRLKLKFSIVEHTQNTRNSQNHVRSNSESEYVY